ncbi:MAG: acyl-protein synthetase [Polyangiaceae bacterium]|nr:acyl-protein synthetase [Polyangiaceae bacterium]
MTPRQTSDSLHQRVRLFIEASLDGSATETFDDLALEIARFQAAHVPTFARYCQARGVDLSCVEHARSIPALPVDVFRLARIAVHSPEEDRRVFRTSGTSQGKEARGEHPMRTTATYELAALRWAERMLWPDGLRFYVLVLAPSAADAPDSSLSFMIEKFVEAVGERGAYSGHWAAHVVNAGTLDLDSLQGAIGDASFLGHPVLVLGTSFAFVHVIDRGGGRNLRLPPGSRVMQTGGFKGRSREVRPDDLRRMLSTIFELPETHIVGEYGMTELSSQLYEGTLSAALGARAEGKHGVYVAPPWLLVDAADPVTLEALPQGETGILRFVDLANVDSAVAIQTMDLGRVTEAGVELFGRAPGAMLRGCSLAVEDLFVKGQP